MSTTLTLLNPGKLVLGPDCFDQFILDYLETGHKRLYLLLLDAIEDQLANGLRKLQGAGVTIQKDYSIKSEPTFSDFEAILETARKFDADSVVAIGGGSILDTGKLLAAQLRNTQPISEVVGIRNLKERRTYLACLPTTSGTGSEVSPNAIFIDNGGNKVGVISPFLVPDAAYIDPVLTLSVPASITAATGIDALTHCLEAYANKNANPVVDLLALKGIELVAQNLKRACENGQDLEARTQLSTASMYGGMCLGPVNTAAVHALAYPLGTDFHIGHGLSIALLLPAVMEFTLEAAPERYANIAIALGAERRESAIDTAREGVKLMRKLIADCGLPTSLKELNIPETAVGKMAEDGSKIQRLLKNNLREVTAEDAETIYRAAF
jgi:alcohol dehydrogenase class IV